MSVGGRETRGGRDGLFAAVEVEERPHEPAPCRLRVRIEAQGATVESDRVVVET
jgi:hypothetical protein